ncbi:Iron-uptake system permease protein FeuB [Planctomycetes bacterium Pan216]|uniref:Iron-uptake system permease protein FeuB n=1 Tax=Kolteria novifilia TaxID=2527975 RepID=A0A518AZW4_9BACT|nr:Iron-uptake system permease protein FeuB [Planctomycetes bacterium Pan216]
MSVFQTVSPTDDSKRVSRYVVMLLGGTAAILVVFASSLVVGTTPISLGTVAESMWRYDTANSAHLVARDVRLPRAILALLVGGSLAAAGAVMQGVTRNPLAGPSIMGLSGGAALANLAAMIAIPSLSYNGSIVASLLGATCGYLSVLGVACLAPGGFSPTRITLAGAVTSSLYTALTQGLVIAFAMSGSMMYWTVGGITNVTWDQVVAMAPCFVVGLVGVFCLAPNITILSLGNEVAIGLGQQSRAIRVWASLFVLLLTGGAVAVAGPVAFVGLMVPHLCRGLCGADYRRLIPMAALCGAALTGFADLASRTVLGHGSELPLGIVTAPIGAPCFVWLIRARTRNRLDGGRPSGGSIPSVPWPATRAFAVLGLFLLLGVVSGFQLGYIHYSPWTILKSFVGFGGVEENLVLWSFRFPRVAFAILVGGGIAVSGAIMQGVLKNDLAEPGLLGVSAGSSLAITLSLGTLGYSVLASVFILPLAAITGSVATMLLVCLLCSSGQHSSPRLLLTGVAVGSAISAISLFASMQLNSEARSFAIAYSAGSLNGAGWNYVIALAVWLGVLVPCAWLASPTLNVLRLGDLVATGLGIRVSIGALVLLSLAVAIGASCVAFAGSIWFLGLIAPHIARRLIGANHSLLIPASALVGAVLLILADVVGTNAIPYTEIPAGIMVSAIGAPYFLYLLTRR